MRGATRGAKACKGLDAADGISVKRGMGSPKHSADVARLDGKTAERQAVFVTLPWVDFDRLLLISEEMFALLEGSSIGEFDGNEVDGETTILFFYGPHAEKLFAAVWPTLTRMPFCEGARVVLRTGPPGAATRVASV